MKEAHVTEGPLWMKPLPKGDTRRGSGKGEGDGWGKGMGGEGVCVAAFTCGGVHLNLPILRLQSQRFPNRVLLIPFQISQLMLPPQFSFQTSQLSSEPIISGTSTRHIRYCCERTV